MKSIEANWSAVKSFSTSRQTGLQYVDFNGNYYIISADGVFSVSCVIPKDDVSGDLTDFENNYKSTANKPLILNTGVQSISPFGAKTMLINGVVKKLFARFTGISQELDSGSNTFTHTISYPWVKIIGLEVVNCEALDTVSLKVYDNASGTYSGVPNLLLNQFAYSVMLPKDFYQKMAQFDADIYQGMVLEFTYNSISAKTIGINILINEVKS